MAFNNVYRGKKVLITGNTGFKGSWLSAWLLMLGAEVCTAIQIVYLPNRPCSRLLAYPIESITIMVTSVIKRR